MKLVDFTDRKQELEFRARLAQSGVPERFREARLSDFPESLAFVAQRAISGEGLYIVGHVGRGKTHLAAAIVRVLCAQGAQPSFVPVRALALEIRESYRNREAESESRIIGRLSSAQFLVLDDLGAETANGWMRQAIDALIDNRYAARRQLIVTSNFDLQAIAKRYGPRPASRLRGVCSVLTLEGPDRRVEFER